MSDIPARPALPLRIARSLLFDLLLPWLVSAVFVVIFVVLLSAFGLFALLVVWPIAFCIFLALCIARRNFKADEAQRRHDATLSEADVLAKYDIVVDGGHFVHGDMRFDDRNLAVVVAREAYIHRGGHWVV